MGTIKPGWTTETVLAIVGVGYSDQARLFPNDGFYSIYNPFVGKAVLDLSETHGAYLLARVAPNRPTAFGVAPLLSIYRLPGNGTKGHPMPFREETLNIGTCDDNNIDGGTSIGDRSITLFSPTGFAQGDYLYIGDTLIREEWNRVARVAGNVLHLDFPVRYAHAILDEDWVRNDAKVLAPIWLPGGSLYHIFIRNDREVLSQTGEENHSGALRAQLIVQSYDEDVTV